MIYYKTVHLVQIIITLLSLLFIILAYLVTRKIIENRRRRKMDIYKEKINLHLFSYLSNGNIVRILKPDTLLKKKSLEELLTKYAELVEGEDEKRRLRELAKLHFTKDYLKQLQSRHWSKKMNCLYHIEAFQMHHLRDSVLNILLSKNATKDEQFLALRILASFQDKELLLFLQNKLRFSEYEYRSILMRLNNKIFEELILGFHRCHTELQLAILDVIGIKKEMQYVYFLESLFQFNSGEIRIRALKSLAAIGYVKKIEPYLPLSKSNKWQERMLVAKLFSALKDTSTIPLLVDLIHDPSWWVRSQAGQALLAFPHGKSILQNVMKTSKDIFAKDMAREWLNKGAY